MGIAAAMSFYVLTQRDEPGCPFGLPEGILHSHYAPDAHKSDYGYLPWYANAAMGRPHEPFPDGLCFITPEKKLSFDIRAIAPFFYLAHERFIGVCRSMNVRFEDSRRIEVCSQQGKPVSDEYWVCRFAAVSADEAIDPRYSLLEADDDVHMRVRRLGIRPEFAQDLFKFYGLAPDMDTLFCSERFLEAMQAKGSFGTVYTDIAVFDWSPKRGAAERYLALLSGAAPQLPI